VVAILIERSVRCAIVSAGLAATFGGAAVAEQSTVDLRIAAGFPRGFRAFDSLESAARAVTAKSEGRIRIELVAESKFGSDDLPAVIDGALHGAVVPSALLASRSPTAAAFLMPLAFESLAEASFVATRLESTIASELADDGLISVARAGMGFAYLTARRPIRVPTEFEGVRLWTPGDSESPFELAIAGAIPVPLGFDQVEAALRVEPADGAAPAVDCVIGLPDLAILKQWHRHLTFVLDLPLFLVDFRCVVRQDALARLTPADRDLVTRELAAAFAAIDDDRKAKAIAFRRVFERGGATLHAPTAAERVQWDAWRDGLAAQFVEKHSIPAATLAKLEAARVEFRSTN
jgi:TRAP-type C4-dicarboxylate transport system substrate-binding protein